MGSTQEQDRAATFFGLHQLLSRVYSLACQTCGPLHAITGLGATFAWGDEEQRAFNAIKLALIVATALAQPDSEGEFVLDTDASAVAISGILHQWQGPPGEGARHQLCTVAKN